MPAEDLKKQEKRKKAIANLKMELRKIVKGISEFKRVFLFYLIVLVTCVIVFGILQAYPNLENTLSASRVNPLGIITSIFTHSNLSHLVLNMGGLFQFIFLFAFCNSTFVIQTKRKMEIFLICSVIVIAVISNILWIVFSSSGVIGASGIVYAVEGDILAFSLINGLHILDLSKLRAQKISTQYMVFMNIIVSIVILIQVFLNVNVFLGVGQGINIFAHGVSFLLGLFASFIWCSVIEKISILN
jgi:membrane associated rhomboid family serine protease